MLTRIGESLRARAAVRLPHTNVYGVARTLLALGTLGTLLFTDPFDIFRPAVGITQFPFCDGIRRSGLFCLAGREHLEVARWTAIGALVVIASGWRPRFTGLLHWFVAWSLFGSGLMVDGGDQITAVLTLLLVPVTICDPRIWHWEAPLEPSRVHGTGVLTTSAAAAQLVALSCMAVIRLQVAGVYLQAAVSKMGVAEWRDGTAVYYWFTDPWFGLSNPVKMWVMPLLANGLFVAAATWGAMMLEILIFAGLIAKPASQKVLLRWGIAFHTAIALVHGLVSFALAMSASLILFLHPVDNEFAKFRARGGLLVRQARTRLRLGSIAVPGSWCASRCTSAARQR